MARAPSITICNIALAEVRASPIAAIGDNNPEARACLIHYDDALQILLESHDWGFAKVRVALAALATNNHSGEWLYAYSAPANMALLGTLTYASQTPLTGVYYPWPYTFPRPPFSLTDYVYASGIIYSNIVSPTLEYVSRDVEEAKMPGAFKRALALELAARLALTLLNDRVLKGDLIQQAEAARRRAMADDLNSYPRRDVQSIDDVALSRA